MSAPKQASAPARRSWKNVLIAPAFQVKFVAYFSLHGIALGIFYITLLTYFVKSTFVLALDASTITGAQKEEILISLNGLLTDSILLTTGFIALTALSGLLFSHRTAGPLYRLKALFHSVASGDLRARCDLRPHDELKDVADAFNGMMSALESRE